MGGREIPIPKALKRLFYSWTTGDRLQKKDEGDSLVTALVSEHVRDNGERRGGLRAPGKRSGGHLQPRIQFPGTEMVPGGRYFRICVASASAADTASLPLPHGRGDDREPGPQTSGGPGGVGFSP